MTYDQLTLPQKTGMCKEFQKVHLGYSIMDLHKAFAQINPEVVIGENDNYSVWANMREEIQELLLKNKANTILSN